MRQHLFLWQSLLDQQQVEGVELREMLRVRERVSGVGVDLKGHIAEAFADRTHRLHVPARLYLQLDAAIALVKIVADRLQQLRYGFVDADRDAAVHGRSHRAEVLS